MSSGYKFAGGAATAIPNRSDVVLSTLGLKGQNFDIFSTGGTWATATIASQWVYYSMTGFEAGDVINNIFVAVGVAGIGTAPTGIYLGLYSLAGAQLGVTTNLAASSIWTASTIVVSAALSSPYTVAASGGLYLAFLQNGAFAGTALKLQISSAHPPPAYTAIGSGPIASAAQSGQATMPGTASIAGNGTATVPWFGWD